MRLTRRRAMLLAVGAAGSPGAAAAGSGDARITAALEPIRHERDLPALGAAVILGGRLAGVGVVGRRKDGDPTPASWKDRWHLGSCTKAMTATLIGLLVEEGKLDWETPLSRALHAFADTIHPRLRSATVAHLLAHRAGLSGESAPRGMSLLDVHRLPGGPREQRRAYLARILAEEPVAAPGERFVYSNRGYVALGAIVEAVTGLSWEAATERRLFRPLGMRASGFGAPGTAGRVDQPWQHRLRPLPARLFGGRLEAIAPGPLSDNPPALGPAGRVHASLEDWARFVREHLRGESGERGLLRPETVRFLHTPRFGGDYAGGWIAVSRPWGHGTVLTHAGSNTLSFAVVWVAPRRRFAVMAVANQGGEPAERGCDEAAAAMIRTFLEGEQR